MDVIVICYDNWNEVTVGSSPVLAVSNHVQL